MTPTDSTPMNGCTGAKMEPNGASVTYVLLRREGDGRIRHRRRGCRSSGIGPAPHDLDLAKVRLAPNEK